MSISKNWKTVPLGKVCRVIPGYAFKSKDWCAEGIPVIKIKNVQSDRSVNTENADCVPESIYSDRLKKFLLEDGDILLAMTGATAGKVGKLRTKSPMLLNQRVAKIKPVEADPDFIWSLVSSDEYQTKFFNLADGAAQPNMSGGQIEGLELRLPDLPTQRKIAGILSAYDNLIENNLRRIKILEEMAQSLYREWFVHFRYPGHESVPLVDSPLGPIPDGWERTTIGRFEENKELSLQTGPFGTQLKASYYTETGTPVINVRNIGFGTLRAEKLEFLPPDKEEDLKRHKLKAGDIVFGRKGAVERHLLVGPVEDGWIQGSDCIRLRVLTESLSPQFLSIAFREPDHQRWMMNQCSGGATMASLNQDILCRIPVVLPSRKILTLFDNFISKALDEVDILASKNQNLRKTRDLLLPKLLSSENPSP